MPANDSIAEDNAIDKARCRRCGGRGEITVMETIDQDGTQSPLYDAPCPRCAGSGTEPQSVAEIISAGIRVQRDLAAAREADRRRRAVTR